MCPSSSGSWSGARGADIIDLDRYMRGAVRPSRPSHPSPPSADEPTDCELVVDGGGAAAAVAAGVKPRHKRFSHDSGVSDSSYSRQRRRARPHRRTSTDGPRARPPGGGAAGGPEPSSTRTLNSSKSLRAFRTVCEQALLEQQRQIAHVTQLCERLTERAERSDQPDRTHAEHNHKDTGTNEHKDGRSHEWRAKSQLSQSERVKSYVERQVERRTNPASSADVSELSSSTSRSTKDPIQKDRHRTQQCKTYKIIMSKLDELNRLFSSRGPPGGAPRSPLPRHRAPSSSSVTVCDKLIATEPVLSVQRVIEPTMPRSTLSPRPCSLVSRRVTHAFSVDIAPPQLSPNVVVESVVKGESEKEDGSRSSSEGGDPRCGFDLDDPFHLYSQAKKLQTLTARTGRSRARGRSAEPTTAGTARARPLYSRSPSLCAACRDYWRSLRDCLLPQLFSQPDHCKC